MEITRSGLPREAAHGSLSADMFDSLTWAWATLGSFFDLQPRASQSSCHSSLTLSKGQLVSMAPFSWLSIMSVGTHYKDIMRFHSALGWVGIVDV